MKIFNLFSLFKETVDFLCEYDENFLEFFKERKREYLKYCQKKYQNFYLTCGATKMVIVYNDYDYVLKIPFKTSFEIDYCKKEYSNYIRAKMNGIDSFFAESLYVGNYNDIPCYAMKKVECGYETIDCFIESNHINCYYEDEDGFLFRPDGEEVLEIILEDLFEEEIRQKFWKFCSKNNINDLHEENFGFINGELKIIDYSGYSGGMAR